MHVKCQSIWSSVFFFIYRALDLHSGCHLSVISDMSTMKMKMMMILLSTVALAAALPLSTSSRWIVDPSTGERVKLVCVNWVAHEVVVVAEGLSHQPVERIAQKVKHLGFNCVRLTWPLFLMTNDSLASTTVRQSFSNVGLDQFIPGFEQNNPSIIDLTLIDAYKAVVHGIASNDVMIILDNHISKPGWCCNDPHDGSGFFGERYFDPKVWIKGLIKVATMFDGVTNVVGISLRNELRGPKQNKKAWYRYMQQGAEAVHKANPNVLTILSGLWWDTELTFLHKKPVNLSFTHKLVYEVHWYSFSDPGKWESGNENQVCGQITKSIHSRAGFLTDQGYPLFVSEFGVDNRGIAANDNKYFNCFLGWAAEHDLDWAVWTLIGSYYIQGDRVGNEEVYGVLDKNWRDVRNSSVLQRISALQTPFQGPGGSQSSRPDHKLIFHPGTGLCVRMLRGQLELGPCPGADGWSYSHGVLKIVGIHLCLMADDLGKAVKLGLSCSTWEMISNSRMHLASKLGDGNEVCLDVGLDKKIVTNECKCLGRDIECDPGYQWFKIIDFSRF